MAKKDYSHSYDKTAPTNTVENKEMKDKIALVVSLIFILALGFFGYRYFNGTNLNSNLFNKQDEKDDVSQDISSTSTTRDEQDQENLQDLDNQDEKTWTATDYKKGDIKTGDYQVQKGDTLWEIAEAVYGNGAQWTQILNANSNDIGFLPSGQNALIFAGQTLVIPAYSG